MKLERAQADKDTLEHQVDKYSLPEVLDHLHSNWQDASGRPYDVRGVSL